MNGGDAISLDATLPSTEKRTNQSSFTLKPTDPNRRVAAIGGTVADNELVIRVTDTKTKEPTKIFLSGLSIGRDATRTK